MFHKNGDPPYCFYKSLIRITRNRDTTGFPTKARIQPKVVDRKHVLKWNTCVGVVINVWWIYTVKSISTHISATKEATGDPLVSKRPDF